MKDNMKESVLKEVEIALSIEKPIGFVAVDLTECNTTGKVVPTIIDISHCGLGKFNSEELRTDFHSLGKTIAGLINKVERRKA